MKVLISLFLLGVVSFGAEPEVFPVQYPNWFLFPPSSPHVIQYGSSEAARELALMAFTGQRDFFMVGEIRFFEMDWIEDYVDSVFFVPRESNLADLYALDTVSLNSFIMILHSKDSLSVASTLLNALSIPQPDWVMKKPMNKPHGIGRVHYNRYSPASSWRRADESAIMQCGRSLSSNTKSLTRLREMESNGQMVSELETISKEKFRVKIKNAKVVSRWLDAKAGVSFSLAQCEGV